MDDTNTNELTEALLAVAAYWEKEAAEYDEIRAGKEYANRPTARSLHMGRAEAHRKCAKELRKLIG